jgi:serine/threonine-protein kinase
MLSIPVQRTLNGRYRLDRVLGRGGMGTVFGALDLQLNRHVAVKVVEAGRIVHSVWLQRFSREARALARLQHENIVLTYDFGVVEEEAAYLVMEFVGGSTLRAEIDSGAISSVRAAEWFRQLLDGVMAAHAAGIVHRDLKPENLLIGRAPDGRERVKIADFGVAKWLTPEPGAESLTLPGTIVGSLRYMSPEQLAGQPVDTRSDMFAIGVMAVEVLTGETPFKGTNYAERIASGLQDSEQFESWLECSPALQMTLRKCLAKDPKQRFSSMAALQAELIPQIAQYRADISSVVGCV